MKINNRILPKELVALINKKAWRTPSEKILEKVFGKNCRSAMFYDFKQMKKETEGLTQLCEEDYSSCFLSESKFDKSDIYGEFKIQNIIIIGDIGIEEPICLYYKSNVPKVIYLGENENFDLLWKVIAEDFQSFCDLLNIDSQ